MKYRDFILFFVLKQIYLVETLYPAKAAFPDTEWLIGNHADELVPWYILKGKLSLKEMIKL